MKKGTLYEENEIFYKVYHLITLPKLSADQKINEVVSDDEKIEHFFQTKPN